MRKLQLFAATVALMLVATASITSCKQVTDSDLLKSVQTVLATMPEASAVTGQVTDKVLTLSGTVQDEATIATIETAVKAVKGLKSVVNNLTVVPPAPDFAAIDAAIQSQLAEILKDNKEVVATVKEGVIFLKGEIKEADLPALTDKLNALNPEKIDQDSLVLKK